MWNSILLILSCRSRSLLPGLWNSILILPVFRENFPLDLLPTMQKWSFLDFGCSSHIFWWVQRPLVLVKSFQNDFVTNHEIKPEKTLRRLTWVSRISLIFARRSEWKLCQFSIYSEVLKELYMYITKQQLLTEGLTQQLLN